MYYNQEYIALREWIKSNCDVISMENRISRYDHIQEVSNIIFREYQKTETFKEKRKGFELKKIIDIGKDTKETIEAIVANFSIK